MVSAGGKVTAKKAGTAKITVSGTVADKLGNESTVTKTISVTVKAKSTSSSNSSSNSNSGSTTKTPKFTSVNQTMYTTGEVNIRKSYSTSSAIIKTVSKGTEVTRTGIGDNGWSKITYNGQTAYISSKLLTKTKPAEDKPKTEEPKNTTSNEETNNTTNVETNESKNNEAINNTVDDNNSTANEELSLSSLEIAGVNFSEGFDSSKHSYGLKLNFFVKSLDITAKANKEDAKVEIIGNQDFVEGENNVTILLTSADGNETATYQIKVTVPSEVASAPQNNIQFYLMCGTIILAAIVVIIIITAIYKKANRSNIENSTKQKENDNDLHIDAENKIKKEKTKGKHSN